VRPRAPLCPQPGSGTFAASIENSAGALTDWPFVIVLL
jgi:hypothetical protein